VLDFQRWGTSGNRVRRLVSRSFLFPSKKGGFSLSSKPVVGLPVSRSFQFPSFGRTGVREGGSPRVLISSHVLLVFVPSGHTVPTVCGKQCRG